MNANKLNFIKTVIIAVFDVIVNLHEVFEVFKKKDKSNNTEVNKDI